MPSQKKKVVNHDPLKLAAHARRFLLEQGFDLDAYEKGTMTKKRKQQRELKQWRVEANNPEEIKRRKELVKKNRPAYSERLDEHGKRKVLEIIAQRKAEMEQQEVKLHKPEKLQDLPAPINELRDVTNKPCFPADNLEEGSWDDLIDAGVEKQRENTKGPFLPLKDDTLAALSVPTINNISDHDKIKYSENTGSMRKTRRSSASLKEFVTSVFSFLVGPFHTKTSAKSSVMTSL